MRALPPLLVSLLSASASTLSPPPPLLCATYALNKPYGCLSQFVTNASRKKKSHKLLSDLPRVASLGHSSQLMAVGRLDLHTEGLLLLTTSGSFSRAVTYGFGPGRERVSKEYWCQVDGVIDDVALAKLSSGVVIGEGDKAYTTRPGRARRVGDDEAKERVGERRQSGAKSIRGEAHGPTSWLSLEINEGKNRQVRRMTAAVGFPTLRLVRVRIGGVELDAALRDSGSVREIKEEEVWDLYV
mmetsp:Transcript_26143/g.52140  ORF Transcript_26143/g.52140 Transcript_26143/m.52140 type:complete len:242 (-) Transcript_26143:6-731(-)